MSKNTILSENIDFSSQVQPSEDQLITVPSSLLESLQDRIDSLEDRIIKQDEKIAALESRQDLHADNQLIQLRLIKDLQKKEPGKTEISRAEKIEKYLQARPDHRATFESLKGYLGIDNDRLGKVIRALVSSGKCVIVRTPGDKRKRSIILLPR